MCYYFPKQNMSRFKLSSQQLKTYLKQHQTILTSNTTEMIAHAQRSFLVHLSLILAHTVIVGAGTRPNKTLEQTPTKHNSYTMHQAYIIRQQ
jgi:hypothetical protein